MWDKIAGLIRGVAPNLATGLATVVGGPVAGLAVNALSNALLGRDGGTPEELQAALAGATPDQLVALKKADQEYALRMRELDIDLERIHAGDRDSARAREISLKDWTPMALAFLVTAGFFGVLGWMLVNGMPEKGGEALLVMLGALGAAWTAIISYYFGSSAGSAKKNDMLDKLTDARSAA
ncbi:MAG TPA: hypothetical protein VED40_09400 [Azospirillaceae bacterium]|nr:hypothetical protein [Azospirillaceae bacterium]